MPAFYSWRGLKSLLGVFIALLATSCALPQGSEPSPVQSPNDEREYRLLTLQNDLQVLLISDPDSPKAAAALDVEVGSGDNPEGRGGLAHFLEHMLFLGTDKYPDAAEYEQFITEHGGRRNAYTSFEHTNYFFDVDAPYLPEALDRFAQFFIAPRFDEQYVDREKNAVQAEYQMGLKSDSRRGLDVLQEMMNQKHPFSRFTVGSLDTLADRPGSTVREDLLRFYDKYYSANLMRLVVLGAQPLDELESLVVPMFAAVPNKAFKHEDISEPLFEPGSLPMLLEVEPQATLRQLQVSFPIHDYRDAYRVKPVSYVSNLIGHEGEGSLLSLLKKEGLAESLAAGSGLSWRGGSMLSISIALTEKGLESYQRVLQLLFNYVEVLREQGPQEWRYDESAQLAELRFRFQEKTEAINYVSSLANGMHYYAPVDVLRGSHLMDQYEPALVEEVVERLVPGNALVQLNDKSVETDLLSRRYEVPYARSAITDTEIAGWRAKAGADQLHLPPVNEFIAEDVALADIAADNPAYPAIALELERQEIWFRQDDEFRVPKGAIYINFRSPEIGQNVDQSAAAALYVALLKDKMNEFTYPALLADLSFTVYKHARGLSLRISGYNDKQAVLLERILAVVEESSFEQERFANIRREMIRGLRNSIAKRPSSQVIDDLREALLYGHWGEGALIQALEELDLAGLVEYSKRFWQSASAQVLVYGNYDAQAVERVSGLIAQLVSSESLPELPDLKVLKLASGESLQYVVAVPHDDAVVAWYLQGAGDEWRDRAATALTAQIMKSGFFQQLRTEQQLGYVVSAFSWPQHDVPGVVMLVQSPVADTGLITQAMETFMGALESEIDEAQFARHQQALINEITRPDKNLWERAGFYWQSIAKKQYEFDGKSALAAAVQKFDREQWLSYYREVFLESRHSLQVVSPGKWDALPDNDGSRYNSAELLKQGHDVYQIQ
jgi:secreted Zn-dependent insulinase-like peptidase